MRIGIDLDSTLNTLDEAWAKWIQENHDPDFSRDKWTDWALHELTPAGKKIYDFLDLPGTFRNLGIQPGAREVIEDLQAAGHEVFIPSSCYLRPGREHVFADKMSWVIEHLPSVDPDHFIPIHHKYLLSGLALLIDDGPHNFDEWPTKGLLFDGPWNRKSDYPHRAVGWDGVREWLTERGVIPKKPTTE